MFFYVSLASVVLRLSVTSAVRQHAHTCTHTGAHTGGIWLLSGTHTQIPERETKEAKAHERAKPGV